MQRVLFHSTIFGPIHSRRLGASLGVNLSPVDGKICSFDCLYCEAGFNAQGPGTSGLPPRAEVRRLLAEKLERMRSEGERLDAITFSGNGEPTLHPDFEGVISDTIELRDRFFPQVKISVLSNATQLHRPDVVRALRRVDANILKLDSALPGTFAALDRPASPSLTPDKVIPLIAQFGDQAVVQTMLLRGTVDGHDVDNTTPAHIDALTDALRTIGPRLVMLYSIDRPTPARNLEKIPAAELESVASRLRLEGFNVQVN